MDRVHGNLNETDKQLEGLESNAGVVAGIIGNTAGKVTGKVGGAVAGGLKATGIDAVGKLGDKVQGAADKMHVHEDVIDPGGEPVKEGWLSKRSELRKKWEKFWFRLCPAALFYYADEQSKDSKGGFRIAKGTRGFAFKANDAPGDALKHRGEKPAGFVVRPEPDDDGKDLFYLDAESEE